MLNKGIIFVVVFCLIQTVSIGFAAEDVITNVTAAVINTTTTELPKSSVVTVVTSTSSVQNLTTPTLVELVTTPIPTKVVTNGTTAKVVTTPIPVTVATTPTTVKVTSAPVKDVTTPTPAAVNDVQKVTEVTKPEELHEVINVGPEVAVKAGKLRPRVLNSRKGREYFAFMGVPFANPPVRYQRFKPPSPVSSWDGVLNATKFAPSCVQYNLLADEIEGEEDCLFLNVFTPKLGKGQDKNTRFPVIVFIHQGAFMFGSTKDYEAKYLMDEDVVLVTIAYRLGSFGFLNTETGSDANGNQGLKDQVLALQWIQENIDVFNGEKNLVTIMGESAGGASGLFARAISMSGTALSPWAFTRTPIKNAKKLGTMLNCPTSDMYDLFMCLQGIDALVLAQKHKDFFEWGTDPIAPFGPSVEVTVDEHSAFIKESPYSLINKGQISDSVWMLGVVEDVCLLDAWSILNDPQLIADMNQDWHRVAPLAFAFRDTALESDAVSNQIRAYYFGSQIIGNETSRNLTNLYSDRWFNHPTRTAAILHAKKNEAVPIYLYQFSYQGKESHLKFLNIQEKLGVSEGDELQYLFNMGRFSEIKNGDVDEDLSDKFIKLFVSFAQEGKPSKTWNNSPWVPMTRDQVKGDDALMFYKIDKNCSVIDEPYTARMSFWDNLPLNELGGETENPSARSDAGHAANRMFAT